MRRTKRATVPMWEAASGRTVNIPFIQSVYCATVLMSSSGSACAENVEFGVQYARQTSHPLPVSHASKKTCATSVIDFVWGVITIFLSE